VPLRHVVGYFAALTALTIGQVRRHAACHRPAVLLL
jgi:hypothetical protein